jgi:hypothetical protein
MQNMESTRSDEKMLVKHVSWFIVFRNRAEKGQEVAIGIGIPEFLDSVYSQGPSLQQLRREFAAVFSLKRNIILRVVNFVSIFGYSKPCCLELSSNGPDNRDNAEQPIACSMKQAARIFQSKAMESNSSPGLMEEMNGKNNPRAVHSSCTCSSLLSKGRRSLLDHTPFRNLLLPDPLRYGVNGINGNGKGKGGGS